MTFNKELANPYNLVIINNEIERDETKFNENKKENQKEIFKVTKFS